MTFVYILLSATCSVLGQLSLKNGMNLISRTPGGSLPVRMATSPWVIGGLGAYGFGVIFWTMALSTAPLSFVYPFGSLAYIGILVGSYFIFKEPISRMRLVGIGIIILGLLIISQS
jgi:multidrug transporter EmrE-like cation transporter